MQLQYWALRGRGMKVGDMVKWTWRGVPDPGPTQFTGLVLGSRLAKTDGRWPDTEEIVLYRVLVSDGVINEIREDIPDLEVVSENR